MENKKFKFIFRQEAAYILMYLREKYYEGELKSISSNYECLEIIQFQSQLDVREKIYISNLKFEKCLFDLKRNSSKKNTIIKQ
jgi:hypothetical protein